MLLFRCMPFSTSHGSVKTLVVHTVIVSLRGAMSSRHAEVVGGRSALCSRDVSHDLFRGTQCGSSGADQRFGVLP